MVQHSKQSGSKPNLVAKFWLPNLVLYQTDKTGIVCLSHADVLVISSSSCRFTSFIYSALIFKTRHYLNTTKRASYAVYSMTTSCHWTIFRINITVWGDSPHKGPAMRIFVDKFVVCPNTCSANSRISMTLIWRYYNVMGCVLFNVYSDHSEYGLSQLETTLHCNVVSHWLNPHSE